MGLLGFECGMSLTGPCFDHWVPKSVAVFGEAVEPLGRGVWLADGGSWALRFTILPTSSAVLGLLTCVVVTKSWIEPPQPLCLPWSEGVYLVKPGATISLPSLRLLLQGVLTQWF